MGMEEERDGLCSLSVADEGPEAEGDRSHCDCRRRWWFQQERFLGRRRSAAFCDRARTGRAAPVAPPVNADAVTAPPPAGRTPPGVSDRGSGAAGSLALEDPEEGI